LDEEFVALVEDSANSPDHGRLRPWRLVLIRGRAREMLGTAFAAGLQPRETQAHARAAAKALRAPLLVSIVFAPRPNPRVPEWEQLAAVTAVVHSLLLLLHAKGWGAMWRTGGLDSSPHVRELLGLAVGERCLGWLYVGTPDVAEPPRRPKCDVRHKLFSLGHDGSVSPMFSAAPVGSPA
jgi:nitroreductase